MVKGLMGDYNRVMVRNFIFIFNIMGNFWKVLNSVSVGGGGIFLILKFLDRENGEWIGS